MPPEWLIPREERPIACQENFCMYEVGNDFSLNERGEINLGRPDAAVRHEFEGGVAILRIPDEQWKDGDCDVWSLAILPWLESLHAEGEQG